MRLKLLVVLLVAICIAAAGFPTANTNGPVRAKAAPEAGTPKARAPLPQDPEGTIDGAKNPEKVPDHAAYSLLFRLLSGRKTEVEKNRARAYVRMMLRESGCTPLSPADEAHVDAVLAAAEEFNRRVGALDRQAQEVKGNQHAELSPGQLVRLRALQKQKEALVMEIVAGLPRRLGVGVAERLHGHVNQVFKRKMKIKPNAREQAAPANAVAE